MKGDEWASIIFEFEMTVPKRQDDE